MTKYKQFKDLTREEKLGIFEAALDGELESWGVEGWYTPTQGELITFRYNAMYRRKSYQLNIPWESIADGYKWAAMNKSGCVYLFVTEPSQGNVCWTSAWSQWGIPLKDKPDASKWKETLTKRPEGENK